MGKNQPIIEVVLKVEKNKVMKLMCPSFICIWISNKLVTIGTCVHLWARCYNLI